MDIHDTLVRTVERSDDQHPALVFIRKDDETLVRYSWEEYLAHAQSAAIALHQFGYIKRGKESFIACIPLNKPESLFVLLGVIIAGGIPVPIHVPLLRDSDQKDFKSILADCQPTVVLCNEEINPHLRNVGHITFEQLLTWGGSIFNRDSGRWQTEPKFPSLQCRNQDSDRTLIMPYTSGTSGKPKGVMLSHGNVLDRVSAVSQELGLTSYERLFSYLSLGHISDLIASIFMPLYLGCTVYFTEHAYDLVFNRENFREHFLAVLKTVRPTAFLAVPKVWWNLRRQIEQKLPSFIPRFLVRSVIKRKMGLDKTQHFISAADKISYADLEFFKSLGMGIRDIYGQTETSGPVLIDGKEIGDVNATINLRTNEIQIQGPNVMSGYYHNTTATEAVLLTNEPHPLYRTGDLGELDWSTHHKEDQPRILINGRIGDDIRLSQGESITADTINDLEQEIRRIAGVREVIVCGASKPYLVALIFPEHNETEEIQELERQLFQTLPGIGEGLKRVKKFEVVKGAEDLLVNLKPKRKAIIRRFEKNIAAM
ncbi:MAG: AMP-binding protein [bacterium]|nr:AMP-binding protein [bacterium]